VRKLLVLAATVAAMLAGTQSAWAASGSTSFSTAGRAAPGYATATLRVEWNSATNADLYGSLTDHCPGNGLGVYLHLRLVTVGGDTVGLGTYSYSGGCGEASHGGYITSIAGGYGRLKHIDGKLCEEDHNGSTPSVCTGWQAVDNPHT
jgi:hypothetical protein